MRIKTLFQKLSKKNRLISAALIAVVAIAAPVAVLAGYGPNGPDRVIYDFSNPAQREGAFDAPRFNSYINTNVYGDERAFVDAKECVAANDACYSQGQNGGYKDQQPVESGKEYIIRAYVHNIANPALNTRDSNNDGQPDGVAKNTRIRFEIPSGTANGFTLQSRISADNAIPKVVYDTVDLRNGNQAFSVEYVPGSARIFNASHPTGLQLSDNIMGANGTAIGNDQMDGVYRGCFEYSSFVVIRVKVKNPGLDIQKRVSKVDMPKLGDSYEQVNAKRGDTVSWRIDYKNVGTAPINNLIIRDTIPAGTTLVPGSVVWSDSNHPNGEKLPDNAISASGVNLGTYSAGSNGVIRFKTKINTDIKVCELRNVAYGKGDNVPEKNDDAKVVIENCNPPKENCPTNPNLPKDSPDCAVCPYNPNLPKDSKDCQPPVTKIPSTGIGGILSGLLGSSAAGYSLYAYVESKKGLKSLIGRK